MNGKTSLVMSDYEVTFGHYVKDIMSNFKGVITGIATYSDGYEQVEVTSKSGDSKWLGLERIKIRKGK